LGGKRHAIRKNDRLDALFCDISDQVDNLWVDERLTPRNGEVIGIAPFHEEIHFFLELFQGFMSGYILAVAALAVDIADIGDFDPGYGVVIHRPGQAVVITFFEHVLSCIAYV